MKKSMPVHIAFDPELSVSPAGFSTAWNASDAHREVATAHFDRETASQYIEPALVQAGLVVLGSVATGLLTNAIWDLIKELLFEQGVTKKASYKELTLPDGSRLVIVSVEEKEN